MTVSGPSAAPLRVLAISCAGRHLAIIASQVQALVTVPCTPPPPGSAPWVGGLADLDDRVAVVVAPFGCDPVAGPHRPMTLVVLNGGGPLPAAVAVDGVGIFAEAIVLPQRDRISIASPTAWLRPCRLSSGQVAVLLDGQAVVQALAMPAAAGAAA